METALNRSAFSMLKKGACYERPYNSFFNRHNNKDNVLPSSATVMTSSIFFGRRLYGFSVCGMAI